MSPEGPAFDLGGYLTRERALVEDALRSALEKALDRVPDKLCAAISHGVTSGGKRLRPILCVAAYRASGGAHAGIYALAASLEMIHAYSLMHDDLPCMDDADLRRGQPTTHRIAGEEVTMVAGAALIPAAALQAWNASGDMELAVETRRGLVEELTRAAGGGGMVGGQLLDLLGEESTLSEDDLTDLHRRKTGALLRASLRMGGLAAGAGPDRLRALEGYGDAIGLAFQVADDVLDATSSAHELGKNPSDTDLGKSTFVSLFGLDEARRRARALVEQGVSALRAGGLRAPELEALAAFVVERNR